MYVIIVGAGRIGVSLTRWLLRAGHEVALVDRDPARCSAAEDELGSVSVVGDGTEAGVLTKAGVNRADIVVATTNLDDVNLVVCQLAAHQFGVNQTVGLVNISEHERLFDILGVGKVINTTDVILGSIQNSLTRQVLEQVEEI